MQRTRERGVPSYGFWKNWRISKVAATVRTTSSAQARKKAAGAGRRKKRKRPRRGRNRVQYGMLWLPVFIFFTMLSGLAVFYVWERLKLREISREIVQQTKAIRLLQEENSRLRAQAEELASYRRIYEIARDRFGFIELRPKIVYTPAAGAKR